MSRIRIVLPAESKWLNTSTVVRIMPGPKELSPWIPQLLWLILHPTLSHCLLGPNGKISLMLTLFSDHPYVFFILLPLGSPSSPPNRWLIPSDITVPYPVVRLAELFAYSLNHPFFSPLNHSARWRPRIQISLSTHPPPNPSPLQPLQTSEVLPLSSFFFLKMCLFILEWGGGKEGEEKSQEDSPLSTESTGLDLWTLRESEAQLSLPGIPRPFS